MILFKFLSSYKSLFGNYWITGQYELHFLAEGDYDLYYAGYTRDESGELSFQGLLTAELLSAIASPVGVTVSA